MNKKKIIILNDYGYCNGGAAIVGISAAIGLANFNYNVTYICGSGPIDKELTNTGVAIVCLNQKDILSEKNKIKAILRGIWNQKAYRTVKNLISKEENNDCVVFVHQYSKILSASIFKALSKNKSLKIYTTLHDYFTACPNGGFYNYSNNKLCKLKPLSTKCICSNCDVRNYPQKIFRCMRTYITRKCIKTIKNSYAINVSELNKKILEPYTSKLFDKMTIIYNPIQLHQGTKINFQNNKYYIFLGRLSEEKGIRFFCKAMTELNLEGVVLGDGPLLDEMKASYGNIKFVGWCNNETKDYWLNQAKCLIFPSLVHETFGLAIVEALSYGIPCIMSTECGASNLIKDGINGYLFPIGNYQELVKKIHLFESNMIEFDSNIDFKTFTLNSYIRKIENLFL